MNVDLTNLGLSNLDSTEIPEDTEILFLRGQSTNSVDQTETALF